MPSDYLDYENNLALPPQEIKSQHELSEQGRQSDVLIKAIDKCEKLEKEIIALKKEYQAECNRADELEDSLQTSWRNESKLKELLKECRDYVVNALIELKNGYCYEENDYYHETKTLLTKIDKTIGEKK